MAEQTNLYSSCQLFPKSIVTSQNGSSFNYSSMDSLENKGETLDTTDSQDTSNQCIFENSDNAFCSSGLRACESVKENEGIWRMKTSKMVENGFSSASSSLSEGDRDSSMKEKAGVPKWDVPNILLRPRVFCLQHAIEVEELLRDKGGGDTRVICHSGEKSFVDTLNFFYTYIMPINRSVDSLLLLFVKNLASVENLETILNCVLFIRFSVF